MIIHGYDGSGVLVESAIAQGSTAFAIASRLSYKGFASVRNGNRIRWYKGGHLMFDSKWNTEPQTNYAKLAVKLRSE